MTILQKLRKKQGLTIRQAAAKAGMSHMYVSYLERGVQWNPKAAGKLLAAYGATRHAQEEQAGICSCCRGTGEAKK